MFKKSTLIQFVGLIIGLVLTAACYAEEKSLYDRLGGETVARAIVEDIWNNHVSNPVVSNRFGESDPAYVKQKVFEIFASATGGPVEYTGKDMPTAHKTMNINDTEFNAVVDDVMKALEQNGIGKPESDEVLAILWSVKDQIVGQ